MSGLPDRLQQLEGTPVRPLASPAWRAMLTLPVGLAGFLGIPLYFGVRHDIRWLRPFLLAGLSSVEFVLAWILVLSVFREAVPGRALSLRTIGWLLVAVCVTVLAITLGTAQVSSLNPPRFAASRVFMICLFYPIAIGFPLLLAVLIGAFRAFPLRPGLVGSLAGLAAGLSVDAGWRLYCHFGDPAHVFSTHVFAIACLMAFGALAAVTWSKVSA